MGSLLLVAQSHAAENWKGLISSQYPIGFEISPKEACENAEEQAKLDAMSLAGCEKLSFRQFETCESSDDAERCAFFQETFNAYDNCFVAKYKLLERNTNKLDLNQNLVCEVAAEINVRGFKSQHNPNLIVQVDDALSRNFKMGDEILVKGKLSQPSFINVLAWYPEIDRDNLYTLHSDELLKEPEFSNDLNYHQSHSLNVGGPSYRKASIAKRVMSSSLFWHQQNRSKLCLKRHAQVFLDVLMNSAEKTGA